MPFYCLRLLDAGVGGHIVSHPDVAADNRVVADGNAPKDTRVTVDGDIVLDDRMTGYVEHVSVGVFLETLGTQCHTLIKRHVTADDASLADNNSSTVVNGKVFANLSTRMNVNACLRMCQLGDDTWTDRYMQLV